MSTSLPLKAIFDGLWNRELASADVETPISPIAPALASGIINKKGVAVVIPPVCVVFVCAEIPQILNMQSAKAIPVFFIYLVCFYNANIGKYYSITSFSYFSADILLTVDLTFSLYTYTPFPILFPKSSNPSQLIFRDRLPVVNTC